MPTTAQYVFEPDLGMRKISWPDDLIPSPVGSPTQQRVGARSGVIMKSRGRAEDTRVELLPVRLIRHLQLVHADVCRHATMHIDSCQSAEHHSNETDEEM